MAHIHHSQEIGSPEIPRRVFLKVLIAGAAGYALVSCAPAPSTATEATQATTARPRQDAAQRPNVDVLAREPEIGQPGQMGVGEQGRDPFRSGPGMPIELLERKTAQVVWATATGIIQHFA